MKVLFNRLIFSLVILISFCFFVPASAYSDTKMVLKLERKVDDEFTTLVEFFSTTDPNYVGNYKDSYIKVDGVLVDVPKSILGDLHYSRRAFSYDSQSGGIIYDNGKLGGVCLMGGASKGLIMSALYLTYKKGAGRITKTEIKPVYSEPRNCLFVESYSPLYNYSKKDAVRIMAILETLYKIYSKKE